jgi:hypothetical protein
MEGIHRIMGRIYPIMAGFFAFMADSNFLWKENPHSVAYWNSLWSDVAIT